MVTRLLLIAAVSLVHLGCNAEEIYNPVILSQSGRTQLEREKRELLRIVEDRVGQGPLASWSGRKISADINVWYADKTLVYKGRVLAYVGFMETVGLQDSMAERELLPLFQRGILLSLNGMAIGDKRRILVDPGLVCTQIGGEANPEASCRLIEGVTVRKEQLIVEATLTESCIPVGTVMSSALGHKTKETGCRRTDFPQRDPSAPIWHIY